MAKVQDPPVQDTPVADVPVNDDTTVVTTAQEGEVVTPLFRLNAFEADIIGSLAVETGYTALARQHREAVALALNTIQSDKLWKAVRDEQTGKAKFSSFTGWLEDFAARNGLTRGRFSQIQSEARKAKALAAGEDVEPKETKARLINVESAASVTIKSLTNLLDAWQKRLGNIHPDSDATDVATFHQAYDDVAAVVGPVLDTLRGIVGEQTEADAPADAE